MLYTAFQTWTDAMQPVRCLADTARDQQPAFAQLEEAFPVVRSWFALMHMIADTRVTHARPAWGIDKVISGNRMRAVREEIALSLPFGNLLHFVKEDSPPQPKVLIIAPLSGHFATLIRNTAETMLRDHDVYVTDWINARDVPLSAGTFGFDDYTAYVIRFLEELGPGSNLVAVCQSCVQGLSATALMAEDDNPAQPRTMTLMGGPIDTRAAPTVVNHLANEHSLDWFENNLITRVPMRYRGRGRRVYPGFMQLYAFMSMNTGRHIQQHDKLYQNLADGNWEEAQATREFYDEYFAVLDLDADFYLETVDRVFQRTLLPKGELTWRGRLVNPDAIRKTALLTVEGERDDISAVGQTAAAHGLCSSLRPHLKRHHLQAGVGHYGVFSGSKWQRQIYPQVRSLILAMN